MRAQANLLSLAVGLLLVTAAVTAGVAIADGAYASAHRQPTDRGRAVALADRLVAPDSPLAVRDHVLAEGALATLTPDALRRDVPAARDWGVRLTLDGERLLAAGHPDGGVTVQRVVLVGHRTNSTLTPRLGGDTRVTLPRRTRHLTVSLDPPTGTTVREIRVDNRTVLRDPSGLDGTYRVSVSRYETATVSAESSGPLPPGSVTFTTHPLTARKATLGVTVDV